MSVAGDDARLLFAHLFIFEEEPPAANVVKLAGNFLGAVTSEALGEAIALVRQRNIDARKFLNVVSELSTLRGR